jgi:hypothetical protein
MQQCFDAPRHSSWCATQQHTICQLGQGCFWSERGPPTPNTGQNNQYQKYATLNDKQNGEDCKQQENLSEEHTKKGDDSSKEDSDDV